MQDIIAGVRTFQREVYPQYRELFEKLAAGQSPEALVDHVQRLACRPVSVHAGPARPALCPPQRRQPGAEV